MKHFCHPASSWSQKVLLVLYEKGIEVEPELVNLQDPAQLQRYRDIYPICT